MQAKDASLAALKHDFHKRMFGPGRIMPLMVDDWDAAEISDRVSPLSRSKWKLRCFGKSFDYSGISGLLENHQIGRHIFYNLCQLSLPTAATEADIVTKQLEDHVSFSASISVKYGSLNNTSRV